MRPEDVDQHPMPRQRHDHHNYSAPVRRACRPAGGNRRGHRCGIVVTRSTLADYPLTIKSGAEHVAALSDALAQFGRTARVGIEEMTELQDAGSADILTEISRGIDKWLWFVEAHHQSA